MMRHLYTFILFLLFAASIAQAQTNYKPGYVVSLKGDTIRGLIDYQEWNYNPSTVQFKNSLSAQSQKIYPSAYSAFAINGNEDYESFTGPISMDPVAPGQQSARDTSTANATIFLKILQKGKNVTLYSYTDIVKTRFFLKETASDLRPSELAYHLYFQDNRTVTDNTFTQQLFAAADKFAVKDETTINRIQKAEYTAENMLEIVSSINNLSAKEINAHKQAAKSVFGFLGLGVNIANYKTSSVQTHLTPSSTSYLPLLSGGVDILVNPTTGRLVFRIEGMITENKYKSEFDNATYPYFPLHYSFTQLSIALMPQFIYNVYNTKNLKIYLSPGAHISSLSISNQNYYETFSGTNRPVNPLFIYRSFIVTASAKVGVKINNRIDASVGYQVPQTITISDNAGLKLTTICAGLNYYFGK